eukprot:11159917-Lingulodinium_polyedra.AAC.1
MQPLSGGKAPWKLLYGVSSSMSSPGVLGDATCTLKSNLATGLTCKAQRRARSGKDCRAKHGVRSGLKAA